MSETHDMTERDGSVMVRVDLTYVEHMRRGGLEGPFARIELDESGSEPRLILTVAQAPTPDSVEWWRSVAAGLGVEIQKLKDLASAREPETFPEPVHRRIVELEAECAALKAAQAPPPDPPHDCEAWRLEGLGCAACHAVAVAMRGDAPPDPPPGRPCQCGRYFGVCYWAWKEPPRPAR